MAAESIDTGDTGVDYANLVRELVEPLLDAPDALRVNCEYAKNRQRVLIRLAFESSDQGRVFGRGGRNIQAIRTVVETAAVLAGQAAHLEVFGSQERDHPRDENGRRGGDDRGNEGRGNGGRRRPSRPPQPRSASSDAG
ncbi:MAG: KH domain-containing protein [Spirulinaceae cyanobacterium SM2_1_0]|nr:KH domain-containing protein [Spirulinaceae cyanobacterium SM2_1_0]